MLFNSFAFLVFFPVVCIIYFLLPQRARWAFLLGASYYFYMNWKPVYAILIFISTFTTWLCSILIQNVSKQAKKQVYLSISLLLNFGILFLYKYFDFLNGSIRDLLANLSLSWPVPNLDLLLPVGISFYTFQAVGYTIDVYRGDIKAEKHLGIYALFVSFFPQLVAGPIERAKSLLPQFREIHHFNFERLEVGLKQMIWGFFMKVVVADRLALYVDPVYNNLSMHNGTTILLATLLFTFQIYCDFAGYSNIAIGAANIMGFDFMMNFKRPYFATNITDFWKRWHISLSTWFRDYVYIPLGGNRISKSRTNMNLLTTFIVSGIWHGANWTFVVWGALHGALQVVEKSFKVMKYSQAPKRLNLPTLLSISLTFIFVVITWVFFRANSVSDAFYALYKMFSTSGIPFNDANVFVYALAGLFLLLTKEIKDEFFPRMPHLINHTNPYLSGISNAFLILLILSIGVFDGSQFIYFQF